MQVLSLSGPRLAVLLPALLLGAFPARAQTAPPARPATTAAAAAAGDDPITLSVFEVSTSKDIGYQSSHAAEATRMNTPIENIPMNVTVFNQQFIEDLVATNTSDLLAYEASAVKTTENDGFLSRGFTSVSSNFLNGFGQTSGFGSQPLSNIERVEVLRGPAAVLYGAGGIGGVFNRITKRPKSQPFFNARVILEDHGSYRSEFDFNRPLGQVAGRPLQFRLTGTHERGETWFRQRRDEDAIAPSLLWNVSRDTQVIAEYFFQHHVKQASWETPVHQGDPHGIVTGDGVYRTVPREIAWISPEDFRDNKRHVGSFDLRHSFTANLQLRSQFQFESKKQDNRETFAESQGLTILRDAALMPRRWRYLPRITDNYRTRNEVVWNLRTGPVQHRLLLGHSWDEQYDENVDWRSPGNYGGLTGAALTGDGVLADNRAGNNFNFFPTLTYAQFIADPTLAGFNRNNMLPLNLVNRAAEPPVPESGRPRLFLVNDTHTYTAQQGLYVNDVASFADERIFVMAGFRYQDFERKTIAFRQGTFPATVRLASAPTNRVHDSQTTSSFGAVWHLTASRQVSLYANLNNTFEAQFQNQPDGSPLDPTTGEQQEIGLRFNLLGGRVAGLVTWFDILQDGVLQADPAPGRTGYFLQVNGQRSSGLEFNLNARLSEQWYVLGGYSNTDSRNDRTGVPQFLQPKHRFTMFNRYRFSAGSLKGLNLSLGTIYTGERPLQPTTVRNAPNWGPLPGCWKVDAIATYRFRPGGKGPDYDVTLKVNNLLDEQDIYFVAQNHRFTVDPGRVWQVIVGVRF